MVKLLVPFACQASMLIECLFYIPQIFKKNVSTTRTVFVIKISEEFEFIVMTS